MRRIILVVMLVACTLGQAWAQKVMPGDTTDKAPDFAAFRKRLLAAVAKRDAGFILSVVSPDVKIGFGADNGLTAFKKTFHPENPRSPFWTEIERIVRLGGDWQADTKTVWYPYVYARFPQNVDGIEYGAATGKAVPMRRSASARAPVVATLSYDIVKVVRGNGDWLEVVHKGQRGFVSMGDMWCPIWRRAAFERVNGRWTLTFFVSGD